MWKLFKQHKSLAVLGVLSVFGFVYSIKVLKDDSQTKWRRHEGIFKDRDRLNLRRIANNLPPLSDDDFKDPKMKEEWLEYKKRNNIQY
nr:unnamed protein product [Naegleria fowleri]